MGSQEVPIESTEDAAIAAIAGKTKIDTLANGDVKAADDGSSDGASLDDAIITSPTEKHDIQAGNNRILEIGTVVAKDPIMLEEVVRDAELGSNTSQLSFEDNDSNRGIVKEADVRAATAENSREQARAQEGLEEEKPQKPSLLDSGVEEATGLNEENLVEEFSSREGRADEDVKDSAGDLIMVRKGDEPTSTSIDQDEDSKSEQGLEVQERPIVGQDEIVHEAQGLMALDEKPKGGAVDDCVVEESTKHNIQRVHEAPEGSTASTEFEGIPEQEVATRVEVENNSNEVSDSLPTQGEVVEKTPTQVEEEAVLGAEDEDEDCTVESTKDAQAQGADETPTSPVGVEESTDVVDESNVLETPPIVAKEEVIPASTQFEGEPELAKSIDVEVDSVESGEAPLPLEEHADDTSPLSDSLPTEDEIVEEVPTGDNVTTAEKVSSTPVDAEPIGGGREEELVALKADDSTKHIEEVDEEPAELHESKDVADESNVVKDELTEVNTEDELVEVSTEDDVKSREAPLPLEEATHVVKNDSNEDVSPQGADETPTSPVKVEVETPPVVAKEEVIPRSSRFEGEPELVNVEVSNEDSVDSTEAPPVHADDVTNSSSQVSDSLPTPDETVEESPIVTAAEDVSCTPVDEDPAGGREEDFVALNDDELTKHIEGEPAEEHESKDVADGSNVVKDELTEVNTEDGLVEGNTEDDVKSREALLPLEEPVKNDNNEVLCTLPMQDEIVDADAKTPSLVEDVVVEAEPVAGGEKESLAANDIDYSTKHTGGVDEAPADVEEPKDVVDESTLVEAEVTPTLEDDVGSREATVPAQVSQNNSNEDSRSLPAHDEPPSVEDVSPPAQEEEPTAGREEKSVKVEDSVQEVETPVEVEDEKAILASNQFEEEQPDVEFREASLPSEAQPTHARTHDETVEEAPTTALHSSIEPTTVEEGQIAGGLEESTAISVEDSKVTKHAEGVDEAPPATTEMANVLEAPVVEEESKEVVGESNAGNETLEESKEVGHESETPVHVESKEGVDESETPVVEHESKEVVDESETPVVEHESKEVVDESETPVAEGESKEVVDESETPVVEGESKEVVDESETPVVKGESKEVVDESETPVVEGESKEVVDESNSTETPSTVTEEEVSPVSTQFEGKPKVAEVAQDDGESWIGEAEAKEVPTLPLVTSVEDVTSTKEESLCGGEESVVASNSGDCDVEQSTKHGQGVVEALPAATELEESNNVVDEFNVPETPSIVVEEEVTPTSTESEGGPEEVTTEQLPLEEEPTQDSTGNEVLAAQNEIVEKVPASLISNAKDVEQDPKVGGEEESRELTVEVQRDADESRKHTEGVEETLPTSNKVDESKDVVDDLETSSTVVERVEETPTEVEAGDEVPLAPSDEVPLAPSDEAPLAPLAVPAVASLQDAPPTLVEKELIDGEEQVAKDVDQQVENAAQEVDKESKNVVNDDSNVVDAPSTRVEDEVTPTSAKHEGEPLAPESGDEVEVFKQDVVESREIPTGSNSIKESSASSGQADVLEEAPGVTLTLVEEELSNGGEEEPIAATEADEAPSTRAELEETKDVVDKLSDLEAPSTALKDEVTPTSHEEPTAPESIEAEGNAQEVDKESKNVVGDSNLVDAPSTRVEDEMTPTKQDVVESREIPMEVSVGNNSIEEPELETVDQFSDLEAPSVSVKDISPTQVEQTNVAGQHEAPKGEDDLPRELNVQLEGVGDGAGSSSEFEAEPQKATTNGVSQHEDVGDLSEEEREPKEASMNGWSANGGLVASTLRSIVTTTMNLVKTTKPSKKKRMKLKKVLEAKKMQQD